MISNSLQKKRRFRKKPSSKKKPKLLKKRYQGLQKIGEGTYGKVYVALDTLTGEKCALKKIRLQDDDEGVPSTAIREISLLKELNHDSIVKLHEVFYQKNKLYLVFEYSDYDLKKVLDIYEKNQKKPPRKVIKMIMYQFIAGMAYLHQNRIVHRDLKPQNLLVNKKFDLKICDFGLARAYTIPLRTYTHEVVTLWYRAPEILLGCKKYGQAVDVWSIGCIFAELMTSRALFCGDSEIDQLMKIFRCLGTPSKNNWDTGTKYPQFKNTVWPLWKVNRLAYTVKEFVDPYAIDLLKKMLIYEPEKRITCLAALSHPYFKEFRISPKKKRDYNK